MRQSVGPKPTEPEHFVSQSSEHFSPPKSIQSEPNKEGSEPRSEPTSRPAALGLRFHRPLTRDPVRTTATADHFATTSRDHFQGKQNVDDW